MTARKTTPRRTAAKAGTVTFEHNGTEYTIDPADKWSLDALEAFEDGKVVTACREILAPKQWADFKATKPGGPGLGEMLAAIAAAVGISGN
ncbi:hypothetical protein [Kribbella sp. CA-293567]|uniref:hypothetical protein n=1 Tax=Kribbella sp. CA-293567 TaxID=3002436 RepID=UPI0022DD0AE9|nr:hypothetical protein [Kribbella sp. CA-293567]WBQ03788.1 hypothetical protein OX958_27940 [Kribbella sp. CA-293567]